MVGLDAAGKTTILYKLKLGEGEFIWVPALGLVVAPSRDSPRRDVVAHLLTPSICVAFDPFLSKPQLSRRFPRSVSRVEHPCS